MHKTPVAGKWRMASDRRAKSGSGSTCVVPPPITGRCFGTMCLACISAGIDASRVEVSRVRKVNNGASQLSVPIKIPGERAVHPWQCWTVYKARGSACVPALTTCHVTSFMRALLHVSPSMARRRRRRSRGFKESCSNCNFRF